MWSISATLSSFLRLDELLLGDRELFISMLFTIWLLLKEVFLRLLYRLLTYNIPYWSQSYHSLFRVSDTFTELGWLPSNFFKSNTLRLAICFVDLLLSLTLLYRLSNPSWLDLSFRSIKYWYTYSSTTLIYPKSTTTIGPPSFLSLTSLMMSLAIRILSTSLTLLFFMDRYRMGTFSPSII